jgi:hypothetical protein
MAEKKNARDSEQKENRQDQDAANERGSSRDTHAASHPTPKQQRSSKQQHKMKKNQRGR